jgi:hypothetical protein
MNPFDLLDELVGPLRVGLPVDTSPAGQAPGRVASGPPSRAAGRQ